MGLKTNSKRYLYTHVHCRIIHNSQDMKRVCVCVYVCVCVCVVILFNHENNVILPFVTTQMDREGIVKYIRNMSETVKYVRVRQILYDLTYKYTEQTRGCQRQGVRGGQNG